MKLFVLTASVLLVCADAAPAHYHMLLLNKSSAKTGEEVAITYQFGHPFEHQLFDTTTPESATVFHPDGKAQDIKSLLKKVDVAGDGNKKVVAYQLRYKPEHRGDYTLVFTSPAVMLEGEKRPHYDTTKVVLHVLTQQGWDTPHATGDSRFVDLAPLTRPYALRAGMLFRAEFVDFTKKSQSSPIKHADVEVELYSSRPPKDLPPDEHTTYTCRTDENGILATTLPDPGWWAVTAVKKTPQSVHRCTFWVPVDGPLVHKPAE